MQTVKLDLTLDQLRDFLVASERYPDDPDLMALNRVLRAKIDALERHWVYSQLKTAEPENRDALREKYLDLIGIPEEYRF